MDADHLNQLAEKIAQKVQESKEYLWKSEHQEAFDGSVPVSDELIAAVKVLSLVKYRGIKKWEISLRYLYDGEGFSRDTFVIRDADYGRYTTFTPEETILLAKEIAKKYE